MSTTTDTRPGSGEATVGIYSNADLAANYAGLKFYLNLTRAVDVGGASLPPVLVRADGKWLLASKEIKVTLGGCGG